MLFEKKPFLLLGLPNTGTDWFAKVICDSNLNLTYFREYFNPITNKEISDQLIPAFGCEIPETINYIARPCSWNEYKTLIENTWKKSKLNFTKENYSIFQIRHHQKKFNSFVLYRDLEHSLPSITRFDEVNSWYKAIYDSIIFNINTLSHKLKCLAEFCQKQADTLEKQVISAHIMGYRQTIDSAIEFKIPIFNYDKLINYDENQLIEYLSPLKIADPIQLSYNILKTRKKRESKIDLLNCSPFIDELRQIDRF